MKARTAPLQLLVDAAARFGGNAALPHVAHLLRWPTRLGWRGSVLWIAFNTIFGMTLQCVVVPWLKRKSEEVDALRSELEAELGRPATDDEFAERLRDRLG